VIHQGVLSQHKAARVTLVITGLLPCYCWSLVRTRSLSLAHIRHIILVFFRSSSNFSSRSSQITAPSTTLRNFQSDASSYSITAMDERIL
jgi:hypothetical protein